MVGSTCNGLSQETEKIFLAWLLGTLEVKQQTVDIGVRGGGGA